MNIKSGQERLGASGLLLVDKPAGISSFDIIRRLRRQTSVRKIGHAGTLDPMATGLMLMLFESATKRASSLVGLDKTYEAKMELGSVSTTGDKEGEITKYSDTKPSLGEVERALESFQGIIEQTPSPYAAIKVNGVRAYKLARAGKEVIMPPRQITIYGCQLVSYDYPLATFHTSVSSGTYIRTLAEDIGSQLGTGAHLTALRRTQVGAYKVEDAVDLEHVSRSTLDHLINI